MKKLVMISLGMILLFGFISDLSGSNKTFMFYGYFFTSVGIFIVFILNQYIPSKSLFLAQIFLIVVNILIIASLYIYGIVVSSNSFGLGLLLIMLFTVLISQLIVVIANQIIGKLVVKEDWNKKKNLIIYLYTILFFILHQVEVPNNYEIPLVTFMFFYSFIIIIFIVIWGTTTKLLKLSIEPVLLVAIVCMMVLNFAGIDANIFALLPLQLVVSILLFSYFEISSAFKMKKDYSI